MGLKAYLRMYEKLNDYLPDKKRKRDFSFPIKGSTTIRDAVSCLKIPPEKIDLVLINGESVSFKHVIKKGDRVSFYPAFEFFDISSVTKLKDTN
ncbi:MAG: hypothetical protein U9R17_11520 [Thermodesulfobacteriota bacterium]|nr:hypothetical protein [Thermodesulfobacteriota bacterium]